MGSLLSKLSTLNAPMRRSACPLTHWNSLVFAVLQTVEGAEGTIKDNYAD